LALDLLLATALTSLVAALMQVVDQLAQRRPSDQLARCCLLNR
jgi:hypothetical protein